MTLEPVAQGGRGLFSHTGGLQEAAGQPCAGGLFIYYIFLPPNSRSSLGGSQKLKPFKYKTNIKARFKIQYKNTTRIKAAAAVQKYTFKNAKLKQQV